MRGTSTESVNEPGPRRSSEGCRGLSPQVAGQPGSLPLARERTGRGPLPAAPMPRTPPQPQPAVTRRGSHAPRAGRTGRRCARCAGPRVKDHSSGPERLALSGLAPDVGKLSAEDILTFAKAQWVKRYPDDPWPGDIDCLFGGPSCQGFSEIGRKNPADERNSLLKEFARLVAAVKPKYFVMENVPGLLAPANKVMLTDTLKMLIDAKYHLSSNGPFILNAGDFGIPQARRRMFIMGSRSDINAVDPPLGGSLKVTVSEALDDLRYLQRYKTLRAVDSVRLSPAAIAKLESKASAYVQSLRSGPDRSHGSYGLGYSRPWDRTIITASGRTIHRDEVIERFRHTAQGSEERISRLPRLRSDGLATTLRAGTGRDHGSFTSARPIHHLYPRVITVREAARLHSFPDWFQFHATKWHAFQQIGNSVPPFLAKAVATSIIQGLGYSTQKLDAPPVTPDADLLRLSLVEAAIHYDIDMKMLPKESRVDKKRRRKD